MCSSRRFWSKRNIADEKTQSHHADTEREAREQVKEQVVEPARNTTRVFDGRHNETGQLHDHTQNVHKECLRVIASKRTYNDQSNRVALEEELQARHETG